jgi:hypothetical protein
MIQTILANVSPVMILTNLVVYLTCAIALVVMVKGGAK